MSPRALAIAALLLAALLAGCGQTGDLFLPEDEDTETAAAAWWR